MKLAGSKQTDILHRKLNWTLELPVIGDYGR